MAKLKDTISNEQKNNLLKLKNDLKVAEFTARETRKQEEKKRKGGSGASSAAIYSYVGLMLFGKGDEAE